MDNSVDSVLFEVTNVTHATLGTGWYADLTAPTAGQFDLLTVVTHELGHLLGLDHSTDEHNVMASTLPVGTRCLPVSAPLVMPEQMLNPPLLLPETRQDVMEPELLDSTIQVDDTDSDMLPLSSADYVELPRSSPEAIDVRILRNRSSISSACDTVSCDGTVCDGRRPFLTTELRY